MTFATFALGILLVAAGMGGLAVSLSLLPTELGLLYVACGVILLCGGVVTLAIGVVVHRLDALTGLMRAGQMGEHASEFVAALSGGRHEADGRLHEPTMDSAATEATHEASPVEEEPSPLEPQAVAAADEVVDENRAGHPQTVAGTRAAVGRAGRVANAGRPLQRRRRQL